MTNETVNTTSVKLGELIVEHNENIPENDRMVKEVVDLIKWKREVNARLIKTENIKNDNAR